MPDVLGAFTHIEMVYNKVLNSPIVVFRFSLENILKVNTRETSLKKIKGQTAILTIKINQKFRYKN